MRGVFVQSVAASLGAAWLAVGCASPNVNPAAPRAKTGFVDFYTDPGDTLAWDVRRFETAANQFKTLFSELNPPEDGILRLAFEPGHQRFRVSFLNRVIAEPAVGDVEVQDGRVTPVHVTLTGSGVTSVQTKETGRGGTAAGRYQRRTKIESNETKMYRLTAVSQEPRPYQLKQRMPYASSATK